MKKFFLCFVLVFIIIGTGFSQSADDWKWGGLVRVRPLATVLSLAIYDGLEIVADWVPYVAPNIGIPVEIDVVKINDIMGFGILSGIEIVPLQHKEKSGLYFTALGGFLVYNQGFLLISRTNIGYQLVSNIGFVFTPAIGVKYMGLNGENIISLDLMLDIGFAYRKRYR